MALQHYWLTRTHLAGCKGMHTDHNTFHTKQEIIRNSKISQNVSICETIFGYFLYNFLS